MIFRSVKLVSNIPQWAFVVCTVLVFLNSCMDRIRFDLGVAHHKIFLNNSDIRKSSLPYLCNNIELTRGPTVYSLWWHIYSKHCTHRSIRLFISFLVLRLGFFVLVQFILFFYPCQTFVFLMDGIFLISYFFAVMWYATQVLHT